MKALASEVGVRFLTLGFDPSSATEDVPLMPKNRYDIMRAYMPTKGTLGLDMMLRTCTIQVSAAPLCSCVLSQFLHEKCNTAFLHLCAAGRVIRADVLSLEYAFDGRDWKMQFNATCEGVRIRRASKFGGKRLRAWIDPGKCDEIRHASEICLNGVPTLPHDRSPSDMHSLCPR